jgi:hypothetical protein
VSDVALALREPEEDHGAMVLLVSHRRTFFGRLAVTPDAQGPIVPLFPARLALSSRCRGLWSRIGYRRAALLRGKDGLVLQLGRRRWPLADVTLEHRDDEGVIEFRVLKGAREEARVRYRRKGPTSWTRLWSQIDFTNDEPWTWEDRDFGLFAFHVATGTGPLKWRHYLVPRPFVGPAAADDLPRQSLVVDDDGVSREFRGFPGGHESIRWDELAEIQAKFEITGIWSDPALLILRGHHGQVVIPIFDGMLEPALRERLMALPGFDSRSARALDDVLEYARKFGEEDRPISEEELRMRAERNLWTRPADRRAAAQVGGSHGGSYR